MLHGSRHGSLLDSTMPSLLSIGFKSREPLTGTLITRCECGPIGHVRCGRDIIQNHHASSALSASSGRRQNHGGRFTRVSPLKMQQNLLGQSLAGIHTDLQIQCNTGRDRSSLEKSRLDLEHPPRTFHLDQSRMTHTNSIRMRLKTSQHQRRGNKHGNSGNEPSQLRRTKEGPQVSTHRLDLMSA